MILKGTISHGLALDATLEQTTIELWLYGGMVINLRNATEIKVELAFGPIGSYIDMTKYYTKSAVDSMLALKQDSLIPGKDMEITSNNVINNEHQFFDNWEIEYAWNSIDENSL